MAAPLQLLALSLCLWSFSLVCSFNLEPRIPIVKKGSPKSHFGYTVAQHQTILDTVSGSQFKKSWILVGAPKDHNLQPGTNRSGALWKCPLTTNTTDCEQVKTDGFKNPETGLYNFDYINEALAEPAEDEIKDDQWLGVTLKSQGPGKKVLVCAHRYMHKGRGFQWGFGLCYILSQNLDLHDYLEPCRGKPVNDGHQQYGFCQAGTSGLLLEDEAVLGVPGPYIWRGTIHTSNISDNFLLKDKTQYFGPVTENDSPVDKYSYLGYSVTAGRFFGSYMSYVGGAPRANETGQVVFFSREKIFESLLRVDLILQGEMFASSFGFEVMAVDINGDRRDDLVVGAPFYYTASKSGAVYVYMNNEGGFKTDHPFTRIEGAPEESRFGFSMTSLGDLNHDGFKDIAIGAPYENNGAIYIYLGTSKGLMEKPSQVIRAEDMPGLSYNAFGYSLSGGMDLDGNGYPDLLTSSFCSDRVLLIRARPIIDIYTEVRSKNLENIDPTKKGCREDMGSTETCFSFGTCFNMTNDAGTKTGLRLKYEIEEISDKPIARVRFADGDSDQPSIIHRDINLRPEDMGRQDCHTETVYLLDGPRDILQPLKFKLSYEIVQREPRPVSEGDPVPDIDDYPILNQQEAVRYFDGTFAKDCGDDDICISDLDVFGRLDLPRHETSPHYVLRLGDQDTVSLHVEVKNTGEPAYQSTLLVTHHPALAFDPKESETQCSRTSKTQVVCSIGNPLIETTGPLVLRFKESGFPFDSKLIYFTVMANSSSREETEKEPLNFQVEVIKRAEVAIIGSVAPEQVFYGGDVVGESAIKQLKEVGKEVTHKYVVDNRGPWRVDELKVDILWPYQVENNKEQGKWLLYMTEIPTVDGIGECEIDPSYVNPLILPHGLGPDSEPFSGIEEVEGELETTDIMGTDLSGSGTRVTGGSIETSTRGTVSIKTTSITETKKVSTSTKKVSKSSSTQDISKSVGKSTYESSSSSGSSTSQFSSSDYSNRAPFDDEMDGSGYGPENSGRAHGRTHSRVSRRVFSTEHKSRYPDSDFGVNELDNFDDEDSDVVSHHEESHSSTKTSPDGSTVITESHHESRKVTVKEGSIDDIPTGRWGHSGGFHRVVTEEEERTYNPERRYQFEEERLSHKSGQRGIQGRTDEDMQEGSGSSIVFDGSGQEWRTHGGTHRQTTVREETVRRVHSGGASSHFDTVDQTGQDTRVDSDFQGGFDSSDKTGRDRTHTETISSSRKQTVSHANTGASGTYERDGIVRTHIGDDSRRYYSSAGEGTAHTTDSGSISGDFGTADRHNTSEQDSRAGFGTQVSENDHEYQGRHVGQHYRTSGDDLESRRQDSRTYHTDYDRRYYGEARESSGGRYTGEGRGSSGGRFTGEARESSGGRFTGEGWEHSRDRYGSSMRTEGDARFRQNWNVHGGTHHIPAEDGRDSASKIDGSYRRVITEERVRGHSSDGSRRIHGYDDFSSSTADSTGRHHGKVHHRGSARVGGYSSGGTFDGDASSRRVYYNEHERTSSSRDLGTTIDEHQGTAFSGFNRSDGLSAHYGQGGTDHFDSSYRDGSSRRQHFQEYDRFNEEGSRRRAETYDASEGDTSYGGGTRHYSGSYWKSSGDAGGLREGSRRTSHTSFRSSSSTGSGEQYKGRWSPDARSSSSVSRDRNFGLRNSDFDNLTPDENGTYTRVEVDPETGATTVYTKKVFSSSSHWQGDWDRRPYDDRLDSASRMEGLHTRSRRELSRVKREKELIIKPQAVTDAKTGKTMQVVNLNCDGDIPTAKCFRFTCNIRNLGARQAASIHIKSRLWNSTLVEDYPRVSYVSIKSKAALILPEDIRYDQDQSDDVTSAETLAYPDLLDQLPPEEVPLWVILVSIFAGLLVLIIIVLILWKLGFFERKRPDPTLSGNLDKDANGY